MVVAPTSTAAKESKYCHNNKAHILDRLLGHPISLSFFVTISKYRRLCRRVRIELAALAADHLKLMSSSVNSSPFRKFVSFH